MTRTDYLRHEFVEYMPPVLDDGVLYVSIRFRLAVHRCCCGCGYEVPTGLSPDSWKLVFDGESISLSPSVGNWGLACQSHYWVRCNRVRWIEDTFGRQWGVRRTGAKRLWQFTLRLLGIKKHHK